MTSAEIISCNITLVWENDNESMQLYIPTQIPNASTAQNAKSGSREKVGWYFPFCRFEVWQPLKGRI